MKPILISLVFVLSSTHIFGMTAPVFKDPKAEESEQIESLNKDDNIQETIDAKSNSIITLVNKALVHFKEESVERSCHDFTFDYTWRPGEVFVYVLDTHGNILCHGDDRYALWQNINIAKSLTNKTVFDEIKEAAKTGSWVNYMWQNGFKSSYVKQIIKDGELYILGAGFYPESQEYLTKQLVDAAAEYFQKNGLSEVTAQINNLSGPFIKGEISLGMYDFEGNSLANPDAPGFIGQNVLNMIDERGDNLFKSDLTVAESRRGEGWRVIPLKNSLLKSYIKRVVDPKTKQKYYISGGFFPDINREDMIGFVRRGISHLKGVGARDAFSDFNNIASGYVKGPLTIFAYDFNGKNLADGEHPDFVGKDLIDRRDPDGLYITRKMISLAKKYGKGSFTHIDRNAYKTIYFEVVEVPDGKFIIGSGFYPSSKSQSVQSMVYKASTHIKQNSTSKAFNDFRNPNGEFFRGDVQVFVATPNGTELVNGTLGDEIWDNLFNFKDDKGRKVTEDLIALAQAGGGWSNHKIFNVERRYYVRSIVKKDQINNQTETYIVGSLYYI